MTIVRQTETFSRWFKRLKDLKAQSRIMVRIRRIELTGNLGDVKSLKDGVSELRIDYGPGYRLYVFQQGEELVILLCGGDKRTQTADIGAAKKMVEALRKE